MTHRSYELKQYVKEAKSRINLSRFQPLEDEGLYINCKKLSTQEITKINSYISDVLATDDFVPDVLGRLIENNVFDKLSEDGKMRYLLDLSKVYLLLRSRCKENM